MEKFIPTESDKQWTRTILAMVKNGGFWGTSVAMYKKIDEKMLSVEMRNPRLDPGIVESNIERVRIVREAIGVKFIDDKK